MAVRCKDAFPDITGFSDSNIKYIKRWYSFYYERIIKGQQLADQLENQNGHQLGDLLEMPDIFGRVPWKHHVLIISKCLSLDEALFYINKVAEEGWSRSMLENKISAKLFQAQGSAVTNFEQTLPAPQNMQAKEILKDPYHFDFLSMKAEYDERDLEEALVANITHFLLELALRAKREKAITE